MLAHAAALVVSVVDHLVTYRLASELFLPSKQSAAITRKEFIQAVRQIEGSIHDTCRLSDCPTKPSPRYEYLADRLRTFATGLLAGCVTALSLVVGTSFRCCGRVMFSTHLQDASACHRILSGHSTVSCRHGAAIVR